MVSALLIIYFGLLCMLAIFGLHRIALVVSSRFRPRPTSTTSSLPRPTPTATATATASTPASARASAASAAADVNGPLAQALLSVTSTRAWPDLAVHLPIYNEPNVAARAINAAARLQYPGRLEIVILDDSTDATRSIVEAAVRAHETARMLRGTRPSKHANTSGPANAPPDENESAHATDDRAWAWPPPRVRISRRSHRRGYKAGALNEALRSTRAELICIFDADFDPPSDFLLRTVPTLMADPRLALVQARWGHLNRNRRWLTRAQAILLDGHFAVEHLARTRARHWFNFNGTAGVWRRAAIEEAGGWRDATLTEDLDLSYRVQLLGWRLEYLHEVVASAELPEAWSAFRTQQGRWVRGSIETARLMMGQVLRARGLRPAVRFDAVVHLLQNCAYVIMALIAVLLPIAVFARDEAGWRVPGGSELLSALDVATLGAGSMAMIVFYLVAARRTEAGLSWPRPLEILFALAIGAGMSVSNAMHVIRGLRLRRSEFVRTPKTGETLNHDHRDRPSTRHRRSRDLRNEIAPRFQRLRQQPVIGFEILLSIYLAIAIAYAAQSRLWGSIPFLLLYWTGFTAVGVGSLLERPQDTQ